MANKIKCTCGHSWSKSDSSKKDMYICHLCGKDTRSDVPKAQVGENIPPQEVTPEMIQGWREYRNYLDEQGLSGDPRLNTGFGKKTFVDWATKNPKYGVNWETLPIIGQGLATQKQKVKEAIKTGKVSLSTPISEFNATDVTNAKSKNPWWPGTEFTAQDFADYEEKFINRATGEVIKQKDYGVLAPKESLDKFRLDVDKKDIPVTKTVSKSIPKEKNGGWLDAYEDDVPKAETGDELFPITKIDVRRAVADNTKAVIPKKDLRTKEEARKEEINKLAKKAIANQPVIKAGPGQLEQVSRDRANAERERERVKQNSPLAQTAGLFTPSGYNPGAGTIGAETFVNANPLLTGPIMSGTRLIGQMKGDNPYGFNKEEILSPENALATLGLIGDISMLHTGTKSSVSPIVGKGLKALGENTLKSVKNTKDFVKNFLEGDKTQSYLPKKFQPYTGKGISIDDLPTGYEMVDPETGISKIVYDLKLDDQLSGRDYNRLLPDDEAYKEWADIIYPELSKNVSPEELRAAHQQSIDYFKNSPLTLDGGKEHGLFVRNVLKDKIPQFTNPVMRNPAGEQITRYKISNLQPNDLTIAPEVVDLLEKSGYDVSKLNAQDWNIIDAYTRGYDNSLNELLRGKPAATKAWPFGSPEKGARAFYKEQSELLKEAVLKNKSKDPLQVIRGVHDYEVELLDPKTFEPLGKKKLRSELGKGDVFKDEAFMSTSIDDRGYSAFGSPSSSELIDVPGGGIQSLAIPEASSFPHFPQEREVILPPGLIRRVEETGLPQQKGYRFRTSIINPYTLTGLLGAGTATAAQQKKNGGWLDKYQDGGEHLGTTNKGFNYNGAWGGPSMAMGGSLPGSVGFTYARTGSIPSNGPYAKKTKASAKDGEEIRAVSDNTRLKPIIVDKPMTRETVKSTNKSYRMSPLEALSNKLKGKKLKESQERLDKTAEKITAIGSLSPNPLISIPSAIGNFTLGITGASTPEDAGLDYMGALGAVGTPRNARNFKKVARRVPFFKALNIADALSDIFEFTPSEDLSKKQNGGEMKFYQEGLDWKPRNISRDGSEIPQAQLGTHMITPDYHQVGENIMEMLSAPQKALTALFSGKYQTPSEAMGIKNPVGSFVIDAALDPLTWIGGRAIKPKSRTIREWVPPSENEQLNTLVKKILKDKNPSFFEEQVTKTKKSDKIEKIAADKLLKNFNKDLNKQALYEKANPRRIGVENNLGINPHLEGGRKVRTKGDGLFERADKFGEGYNLYELLSNTQYHLRKNKEGGEIKKDDNGYWNPENWGEPVEIGSPYITMEGVYEPLLGVSDTGDVQMMYPGEDYEFDGETVTEYPIMQKGGNVPLYVSDPNDPRLKAYQDSLNLYNRYPLPLKKENYIVKSNSNASFFDNQIKRFTKNGNKPIAFNLEKVDKENYHTPIYKKPTQKVEYRKPEPKKEEPIKKTEQPKPIERKQNIYEGSPVYSPGVGSGMPSALIGFANQKGDTTYIKPEDYERFGVPKYGKEYIESKTASKKKNGGWLDKYK